MDFSVEYKVVISGKLIVEAENKEIARQSVLDDFEDEPFLEQAKKSLRIVKKIVPLKAVVQNG